MSAEQRQSIGSHRAERALCRSLLVASQLRSNEVLPVAQWVVRVATATRSGAARWHRLSRNLSPLEIESDTAWVKRLERPSCVTERRYNCSSRSTDRHQAKDADPTSRTRSTFGDTSDTLRANRP